MQPKTAAPRQALTDAEVLALLHEDLEVDFGADLLGLDGQVVADVSTDLRAGAISYDGSADIHRSCDLELAGDFIWGRDRLRLWQELYAPRLGFGAVFWLGVFVLTRPTQTRGAPRLIGRDGQLRSAPAAVKGWDVLYLLRSPVGETWSIRWEETGQRASVADEIRRLFRAAGYTGPVRIPLDAESVLLTEPMVWPLDDGSTTWLRIAKEILTKGGFTPLHADHAGVIGFDLLVPLEQRPVELLLDATHPRTFIGPTGTRTQDLAEVPNAWLYINSSITDREPVPFDGTFDPGDNDSQGLTSIASRGYRLRRVRRVEAADQAALERLAIEGKAADMRTAGVRDLSAGPLPLLGHRDVVDLVDPDYGDTAAAPVRALLTKWGPLQLAGAPVPITAEEVP